MIIRKEIDLNQPLTDTQKKMLSDLDERPVVPDEDCPELTEGQLAQFRRVSSTSREECCKQTVTLQLSAHAMSRAKSFGEEYISVLSQFLENALEHPEVIRHGF